MKLSFYIQQDRQFNNLTPVEADEHIRSVGELSECNVNIEFVIVVLMLSTSDLAKLKSHLLTTFCTKVAFYHRGKSIDAVCYETATDAHTFEYTVKSLIDFL